MFTFVVENLCRRAAVGRSEPYFFFFFRFRAIRHTAALNKKDFFQVFVEDGRCLIVIRGRPDSLFLQSRYHNICLLGRKSVPSVKTDVLWLVNVAALSAREEKTKRRETTNTSAALSRLLSRAGTGWPGKWNAWKFASAAFDPH